MTTPTNAPAAPAANVPAAPAAAPQPGTPEHAAAMVAAFEAQQVAPVIEQPANAPAPAEPAKPAEGEPKPDEKPAEGEQKPDEKPEGEQKPEDSKASVEKLWTDGILTKELTEGGKLSEDTLKVLESAGLPKALIERHVELELAHAKAEGEKLEATLHQAAGGAKEFQDLIAWGKANLAADQREYFDAQLNGPFAAEAIALLKQKRGAPSGDPSLHLGASGATSSTGFQSEAEMVAAMSDPRYQTDPAYRAQVARRLQATR